MTAATAIDEAQVVDSDVQPVDAYLVLRERYLALVESTLAGTIYEDDPIRASGVEKYDSVLREYGWDWPSKAFTMIGLKRLRNFRAVIESVIGTNVPGDIMEAGVWRGGAGIMARAVLAAYGVGDRRVILADSFAGLPPPDPDNYPADAGSAFHEYAELRVPLDEVKRNFAKFGLLDEQVVFLPGWFRDTLPTAPVERVAVLRLDCDMYESSIQALDSLYDRVSINGWIVIDDYEVIPACRSAVHDFLKARDLKPEIYPIDGVGVFFRKTETRDNTAVNAASRAPHAAAAGVTAAGAYTPVHIDFVAWREALIAVVRASEAVALANQAARTAQDEAAIAREQAAAAAQAVEAEVMLRKRLESDFRTAQHEAAAAREQMLVTAGALEEEVGRHERQVAALRAELEQRERAAIAGMHEQIVAARTDASRFRRDLQAVYSSRSWRLTSGYRALGRMMQIMRKTGRLT
jgi:O-methyltransferase